MKLKKIIFDAYRSLKDAEIDFSHYSCLGLVGINESGKSNVLNAIRVLSEETPLASKDSPRFSKSKPSIKFLFNSDKDEKENVIEIINDWLSENSLIDPKIKIDDIEIVYHVFVNEDNEEERIFYLKNISMSPDVLVLKHNHEYNLDPTMVYGKDGFKDIRYSILISKKSIEDSIKFKERSEAAEKKRVLVEKLSSEIEDLKKKLLDDVKQQGEKAGVDITAHPVISEKMKILESDRDLLNKMESELDGFDFYKTRNELVNRSKEIPNVIKAKMAKKEEFSKNMSTLSPGGSIPDANKPAYNKLKAEFEVLDNEINKMKEELEGVLASIQLLDSPLVDKYESFSSNPDNIIEHFKNDLDFEDILGDFLPNVVFWENSDNYILDSETLFSDIFDAAEESDLPRPLFNVFRVCLGINSIEKLKSTIEEIQGDSNERTKLNDKINRKLNEYLKKVWKDYDQEIKVALESEKVLFKIFDPKCDEKNYYSMEERSQGCRTFLSFLLTISAEAEVGMVSNYVLLLDEPETHLHPSGVRYMRDELKKISEKGNVVVFATHSVHMIDRKEYERYIIVKKVDEKTFLEMSRKDRIGYFLQEEVLFSSLNVNLENDFSMPSCDYNFVFEGDGDSILFESFFREYHGTKISVSKGKKKDPDIVFFQGGKCNDIEKVFRHKPIQLGSKWVFILDNDAAAFNLKNFLESKYEDYIEKDILIFQYGKDSPAGLSGCELEDLLPVEFLSEVFEEVIVEFDSKKHTYDAKLSFSENIKKAEEKITKDSAKFKGRMKELLNQKIREKVKNIAKGQFETMFKDYFLWANKIAEEIPLDKKKKKKLD